MEEKIRAARNRTITLTDAEKKRLRERLLTVVEPAVPEPGRRVETTAVLDHTIHADLLTALPRLPDEFADT